MSVFAQRVRCCCMVCMAHSCTYIIHHACHPIKCRARTCLLWKAALQISPYVQHGVPGCWQQILTVAHVENCMLANAVTLLSLYMPRIDVSSLQYSTWFLISH